MKIDNVIWIIIDSVRSYSGEGDWRYRLKIMDELHDFYNFTNAYTAAPSTIMSAASMFTGNNTFKIARNYNDWKLDNDEIIPISKVLSNNGFETLPVDNSKRAREMLQDIIGRLDYKYFCKGTTHNSNWSNQQVLDQFRNVLKKSKNKKKFIMTWFDCRGDVLTNTHIKNLIQELRSQNLYENSLIIMNSDHGYPDPKALKFKNIKKYRHDLVVTEDNIKVPLLIKVPGFKNANKTNIDNEVSLIDIYPTILELLNIENKYKNDGESLVRFFNNYKFNEEQKSINNRYIRSDTRLLLQDGKISTLIKDRYKYVFYHDTGHEEFYNLSKDPDELDDLSKNQEYKEKFSKFKTFLYKQNIEYEKLQESNLKSNLIKSIENIKKPKKIVIFSNLNNNYLNFINSCLNNIFKDNFSINFFSTKNNEQNSLSKNISDLKKKDFKKEDLLIIIDEKNYYRILDLTFLKTANKLKIRKIFLDLNLNKNNLFFSKWIFPLLKYKNNFSFYKNEPFLLVSDIIKIFKLSFKQYIWNEKVETPRMEDLKLHRDRLIKSKETINKKIEFYDYVFYLRNIGIWGGTQTQFWELLNRLKNYKVLVLYNHNIRNEKINKKKGSLSNQIKFKSVSDAKFNLFKNLRDNLIYKKIYFFYKTVKKQLSRVEIFKKFYDIFIIGIYKFVRNVIFRPMVKIRFINIIYRALKSYNTLRYYYKTSKVISVFLTENNIVNTIIYRLIGGKTGQLILNERNDVPKQTNFLIRTLYRMILSEEIIIITNSLNSYNYFIKFHKNTKFVYNFYVNNKENSIANYNKILKTKDVSVLRTVNVGRFVNQKNQIDLIEKINNYDNKNLLYLDIIGRGVLKEKLNNFIIKNNLKNINIVDHTKQQSNYTLKNYDILFINSKFEGQTNLILEAMNENIIIMINDILENELKTIYKNTNFEKIVYFYNSKNFNEILKKISNDKIKIKNNLSDEKEKFIKNYSNFENLTNLHLNLIN